MRPTNIKGRYYSSKLKRMVDFTSKNEKHTAQILDYAPAVKSYQEQPFAITYTLDGKEHTYTPDYLAKLHDGRELLIECKPAKYVQREDVQLKADVAQKWCEANDSRFLMVTDEDLLRGCILRNIQTMEQCGRYTVDDDLIHHIQHAVTVLLPQYGRLTIIEVLRAVNPQRPLSSWIDLLHAAYHHHIAIDIHTELINEQTLISSKGDLIPWLITTCTTDKKFIGRGTTISL